MPFGHAGWLIVTFGLLLGCAEDDTASLDFGPAGFSRYLAGGCFDQYFICQPRADDCLRLDVIDRASCEPPPSARGTAQRFAESCTGSALDDEPQLFEGDITFVDGVMLLEGRLDDAPFTLTADEDQPCPISRED